MRFERGKGQGERRKGITLYFPLSPFPFRLFFVMGEGEGRNKTLTHLCFLVMIIDLMLIDLMLYRSILEREYIRHLLSIHTLGARMPGDESPFSALLFLFQQTKTFANPHSERSIAHLSCLWGGAFCADGYGKHSPGLSEKSGHFLEL